MSYIKILAARLNRMRKDIVFWIGLIVYLFAFLFGSWPNTKKPDAHSDKKAYTIFLIGLSISFVAVTCALREKYKYEIIKI